MKKYLLIFLVAIALFLCFSPANYYPIVLHKGTTVYVNRKGRIQMFTDIYGVFKDKTEMKLWMDYDWYWNSMHINFDLPE